MPEFESEPIEPDLASLFASLFLSPPKTLNAPDEEIPAGNFSIFLKNSE